MYAIRRVHAHLLTKHYIINTDKVITEEAQLGDTIYHLPDGMERKDVDLIIHVIEQMHARKQYVKV